MIPAYNAGQWIEETLDSLAGQTVTPDEVIVVDDGSTDDTVQIVTEHALAVRLARQPNSGAAGAWNRGFREARGKYVAKCPADDLWEPRKLEWQLSTLAEDPSIDLLFGAARDFGVVEGDLPAPPQVGKLDPDRLLPALYENNCFAAPTAIVRRSLHARLGGFREDRSGSEDYDFWLRALETGAVCFYDPRLMARLRKHGGNLSLQALTIWQLNYEIHRSHANAVDERLARDVLARDLRVAGRCSLGLGLAAEARQAYSDSWRERRSVAAAAFALALMLPGAGWLVRRLRPQE